MSTYKGGFRDLKTIEASEDGSLPSEIEVLPMGEWNTIPYGPFKVTTEHFRQMIANFNAGIRKDVPVDVDHDGGRAAGWIKELFAAGERLMAKVEWTPYGKELIEGKIYKLFSPEFSLSYLDPEHSTEHGAVFIAGSLVNRPLFKELSYITASEKPLTDDSGVVLLFSQESMNLDELKTKTKEELTQEETDFLKENVDQLSDEEKAKFGLVAETPQETPQEDPQPESTPENPETNTTTEPDEAVKANDSVNISASELAELRANAEAGVKAKEELTKKKAEELIQTFVANDKGGKFLPKDKNAFVDFYLKCSDEQKASFEALLEVLPETNIAGEIGEDTTGQPVSATNEIRAKAQEKVKAAETEGKKLSVPEAINLVTKENPDLAKKHREETISKNQ